MRDFVGSAWDELDQQGSVSWRFGVIYARKFAQNAEIYNGWRMKMPKIKTLASVYTYAVK